MARNPGPGGVYAYAKESFGYDHGFLTAWFALLTYIAMFWANVTALPLFADFFLGDMFKFGFHYSVFGYEMYFGEALPDPAYAQIPIVAMTANVFREDIKAAEDAGMDYHVAKPIDVGELVSTLSAALTQSK